MKNKDKHRINHSHNKKYSMKILIVSIAGAVIVGPLLIHMCFKIRGSGWIVAEWNAGDMLQYYGMVLTAVITICGLYLTFRDNRLGIKEQSRLDKMPYFSLTILKAEVRNPLWGLDQNKRIESKIEEGLRPKKMENDDYYYKEVRPSYSFLVIEKGEAYVKSQLDEESRKLIINGGIAQQVIAPGAVAIVDIATTYVPMVLSNAGNGPAMNFRLGFNRISDDINKPREFYSSSTMGIGDEFYLGLFSKHSIDDNIGKYILEIYYSDIFDNQYKQEMTFTIGKEDNNIFTQMDPSFKQSIVKINEL